jgi:hypothetical protein
MLHLMGTRAWRVTLRRVGTNWEAEIVGPTRLSARGRNLEQVRRHITKVVDGARVVEVLDLSATALESVAKVRRAREAEEAAARAARSAAIEATAQLTRLGLGRRDVAALTGYSFQRIQQLIEGGR